MDTEAAIWGEKITFVFRHDARLVLSLLMLVILASILIIEDEMDLLDLIDFNLTRRGFVTECALDGRDGMEKIGPFAPDVIILDLMLPGVDGWEICEELKKRKIEIPVIMLTAKSMPEDRVRGLEAGAADYMTKPFSMKELVARIERLFEKKEEGRRRLI